MHKQPDGLFTAELVCFSHPDTMSDIKKWAASVTNYSRTPSPRLSDHMERRYRNATTSDHHLQQPDSMSFATNTTSPNAFRDLDYNVDRSYAVSCVLHYVTPH